jgi:hypothetical protein
LAFLAGLTGDRIEIAPEGRKRMFQWFRVAPLLIGVSALVLVAHGGGCVPSLGSSDAQLHPPATWQPAAIAGRTMPGTPLQAWSGPQGASLVVYRTLPIPGGSAASLVDELANRLSNLPDLKVVARRTETWSGQEAARVEAIAPGTGDALAPSGTGMPVVPEGRTLVPTHRVALGFPRVTETLWITWHYPESAQSTVAPEIEETLKSLRLPQGPPSKY